MGWKQQSVRLVYVVGLFVVATSWTGCQQALVTGGSQGDEGTQQGADSKNVAKNKRAAAGNNLGDNKSKDQLANAPVPDAARIQDIVAKDQGQAGAGVIYVSLAHLAKSSQGTADLDVYRFGVTKALNSLSMNSEIKRLDSLDPGATLYRVNLADFSLSGNDLNTIRRMPGANNAIQQVGGSLVIKGDWLVYAVTRPEAYDSIMGIPNFVGALEGELRVDRSKAVYYNIKSSEVTFEPRVLERIPIEIGGQPGGYYWRSYDFARKDVQARGFQNPERLAQAGVTDLVAGEYFFSLPNGLQGYMLSGFATQHRVDAQAFVATDSNRPQDGLRRCVGNVQGCGYVINGESCITCHERGVKLNDSVVGIKGATKEEADQLFTRDAQRFAAAIKAMGFEDNGDEPILSTIRRYRQDNNVSDARRQGSEVSPTGGRGVLARSKR